MTHRELDNFLNREFDEVYQPNFNGSEKDYCQDGVCIICDGIGCDFCNFEGYIPQERR